MEVHARRKRFGSEYGGYWIDSTKLNSRSVVYSLGVGEDLSFDLDLVREIGCTVFAFDPTPKSISWIKEQNLPEQIQFEGVGIAGFDGKSTFYIPKNPTHVSHSMRRHRGVQSTGVEVEFKKLSTAMHQLGHERIDLLKMDVEGAEYDVISDIVESNLTINQLCVEFHHRFSGFSIQHTKDAVAGLAKNGLKLFHQDDCVCSFIRI